jgi:multidrug resistance protein, MATE family
MNKFTQNGCSLVDNSKERLSHRAYLAVALPFVFVYFTTPLLGAVDTAAIGHLGDPVMIAAVAVASMIFNTILWMFGFLRVSTTAFTAQAAGAQNADDELFALLRPLFFALVIGILLVALQEPIEWAALKLLSPSENVASHVSIYYNIRVWSIPVTLITYVLMGWLMGKGYIRQTVILQIGLNVINILLNIWFVIDLKLGIHGVAWATVTAEVVILVISALFIVRQIGSRLTKENWFKSFNLSALWDMLQMNRDLFVRTICLLFVFNVFTAKGADFGTETLAANAILFQIHFLMASVFDGFANATGLFTGRAYGSKSSLLLTDTMKKSALWSCLSAVAVVGIFLAFEQPLLQLFSSAPEIVELASDYSWWVALFPIAASSGLIYYGMFTGAKNVKPVRNSILQAAIVFGIVYLIAIPEYGNDGLWGAFIFFSLGRSVLLLLHLPKLKLVQSSKASEVRHFNQ